MYNNVLNDWRELKWTWLWLLNLAPENIELPVRVLQNDGTYCGVLFFFFQVIDGQSEYGSVHK